MNGSWEDHYRYFESENMPPAATLVRALTLFKEEADTVQNAQAIDLGCGNGVDTLAMLGQEWKVMAIDNQKEALQKLQSKTPSHLRYLLTTLCRPFEELQGLPGSMLVNATFSLPFCQPGKFDRLWQLIVNCIPPGGRFAGHFFGVQDSWKDNPALTFHESNEVKQLFTGFSIEEYKEVNKAGKTVSGQNKHWHVFHVVARKNPA